ncbi:hypothetical protein PU99_05660 [Pseudomonas putida]|nr:hypothetical protein PU99_05660 [Pseudomonas putida]
MHNRKYIRVCRNPTLLNPNQGLAVGLVNFVLEYVNTDFITMDNASFKQVIALHIQQRLQVRHIE